MKLLIVLISCLVATAFPAIAAADTEPNDGIGQWEGPYAGDTPVNGTFPVDNDIDWYGFYATGPAQVTIPIQNLGQAGSCRPVATLRDGDGHQIASVSPDAGQTATLILDAGPATNRYFLTLEAGCNGGAYAFTLTPASAIAQGAKRPSPIPVPEPNDVLADAFGPLPGGTAHSGTLDGDGEEDWYFAYTADGPQTIDAALTNTSPTTSCAPRLDLLPGEGGTSYGQAQVDKDTVGHVRFTAPSAQKVALRVRSNCSGGSYWLQVDPPGALSQDEPDGKGPAGPTQACRNARNRVKSLLRLVAKRNKELKRARTPAGRKKAKARRRAVGHQLDKARDRVVQEC